MNRLIFTAEKGVERNEEGSDHTGSLPDGGADAEGRSPLMRFLAGKFNEVDTTVQVTQAEILLHIGKIEDYLAQILRKMDG